MTIKELDLFHGAVLSKLARRNKPVNLMLLETAAETGAEYVVNTEAHLFIKKSKSPEDNVWKFTFNLKQLYQLQELKKNGKSIAVALVCGRETIDIKNEKMFICFMDDDKFSEVIDLSKEYKTQIPVYVIYTEGDHTLEVSLSKRVVRKKKPITVFINAIDKWSVE